MNLQIRAIQINEESAKYHRIYAFCHVFRSLIPSDDFRAFRAGVVAATSVVVIQNAPVEPTEADSVGLFEPENIRNFVAHGQEYSEIEDRLLSLDDSPAQFTLKQLVAGETIGHKTRHRTCFKTDSVKRGEMFDRAFKIYESLIRVCDNVTAQFQYQHCQYCLKLWIFPRKGRDQLDEICTEKMRCISHIFAGMAICELMGARSIKRYCSLASIAVFWASDRVLELACALRMYPYIIATRLIVDHAEASDIRNLLNMSYEAAKRVMLPVMVEFGMRDMLDQELQFVAKEHRAEVERVAVVSSQHPNTLNPDKCKEAKFKIVRGRFIEQVCANCGTRDPEYRFKRCSKCHKVFYCGKQCQLDHWKEHKLACNQPATGS